jgi:hypothetical protein
MQQTRAGDVNKGAIPIQSNETCHQRHVSSQTNTETNSRNLNERLGNKMAVQHRALPYIRLVIARFNGTITLPGHVAARPGLWHPAATLLQHRFSSPGLTAAQRDGTAAARDAAAPQLDLEGFGCGS